LGKWILGHEDIFVQSGNLWIVPSIYDIRSDQNAWDIIASNQKHCLIFRKLEILIKLIGIHGYYSIKTVKELF